MRFCFYMACCWVAGLAAGSAAGIEGPRQIKSVVKADPRTGRLVRSVVPVAPVKLSPALAVANDAALSAMIDDAARRHDVDPLLVHSVIRVESAYNPYAVSPKGAEGLMQLMPGTARRYEVANSFNPSENIEGGVRYLKYLLQTFKDQELALAAYNAGEKAVLRYGTVPPYRETADYVRKVGRHHAEARKTAQTKQLQPQAMAAPPEPRIEESVDERGVIHLRTVNQ